MAKNIIKADGTAEPYNEEKARLSFLKAGASQKVARRAARELTGSIKNNMTTTQIYDRALHQLEKLEPKSALRYSLKKAIMDMGPEGFVFEKYIAKVLQEYGYNAEVGQFVKGYCIEHEVDVIAKKEGKIYMIECKYRNSPGTKSDVQTALYLNSRFMDIEKAFIKKNGITGGSIEGWLVTNTKCTSDAKKYARCVGLKIMAWQYPEVENLQYFIESKKLYPLSILRTITGKQKVKLFNSNIILVKELFNFKMESLSGLLSINYQKAENILHESKILMQD
jgi:hypothetical protein